jgi:hypothetical protein
MKFVIEHTFAVSPADYEALYFDEPFNVALGDHLGLGRELRRFDRTADRIVRHVCCEPKRDPDSPAGKAFGTTRASYVEEMDYDVRARRGAWRTIPNILPERVKTEGTLEIASAPGGMKRIVRGEVKARLWGFGGIVERMVVSEIEQSYAKAAAFTTAWLAKR